MMKNSLFADLDALIEEAVASATGQEKKLQAAQFSKVQKQGLIAKKKKKPEDDEKQAARRGKEFEEAEENEEDKAEKEKEPEEKKDDESIPKIGSGEPAADSPEKKVPGTRTSPSLADPSPEVLRNPQPEDVAKKVNALRGGSSLKDKKVRPSFEEYIKALDAPERAALITFLTNVAQIAAPVRSADQVKKPKERGIETRFAQGEEGKKGKTVITKSKEAPKEKSEKAPEEKEEKEDAGIVVVGGD